MRIIAFITEAAPIERILTHIGEPPHPPASDPPADHPPGTMISNRRRTGTSSANRTPASNLASASLGNRRLLRSMTSPPHNVEPSVIKDPRMAGPCVKSFGLMQKIGVS